jgi:uncharacterized protein (TIGR02001 family)
MGAGGALLTAAMLGVMPLCGPLCGTAVAQETKPMIPGTFSANVALTSEYLYRGISQTDDAPALQGGFNYEVKIADPVSVYAGVWGSNVDFSAAEGALPTDGASIEIDWVGGLRGSIGSTGLSWDVGFIYYTYPGADSDFNYDFWEVQTAIGYDFGVAAVTASVNYSPEFFGDSGTAWYPKLAVKAPVPGVEGLTFAGYVAKQFVDEEATYGIDKDYLEWNLSLTYNVLGWFDASVTYWDTDLDPGDADDGKSEAVLFTISKSF